MGRWVGRLIDRYTLIDIWDLGGWMDGWMDRQTDRQAVRQKEIVR